MTRTQHPVRTRFAPSPTGRLHIGGGRTALYAYLLARQTGGQFILRLEDTDQKRYIPSSEQEIINGLHWLGLEWEEGFDIGGPYGPYRQSERREVYQNYAKRLIDSGHAYYCFCSPERLEHVRQEQQKLKLPQLYDGTCKQIDPDEAAKRVARGEKHVIRFKMPDDGAITVNDRLRGPITVENKNLDDYILIKSDGLAVYHLAAMADDYDMKITHVIRGSEWLPTLPLHGHIIRALGWSEPEFLHLSVFLKPSGKGKMSKRDSAEMVQDGFSVFLTDLDQLGYLAEATVNWIALMGWSYDDHTEFFTMKDLLEKFNLDKLNPAPAAINFTKYDHFNGLHIRSLSVDDLCHRIKPFFEQAGYEVDDDILYKITPIIQERISGLDDAPEMAGFFFRDQVTPAPGDLVAKNMSISESESVVQRIVSVLEVLPDIKEITIEPPLRALVEELGVSVGQLFGIMRIAITGQRVSPPLFESMEIIGREKCLHRLRTAGDVLRRLRSEQSAD